MATFKEGDFIIYDTLHLNTFKNPEVFTYKIVEVIGGSTQKDKYLMTSIKGTCTLHFAGWIEDLFRKLTEIEVRFLFGRNWEWDK